MILALLQSPPALVAPDPAPSLRAQYGWGYEGPDGEGLGVLSLLLDVRTGKVVIELHGLGERLVLIDGDRASGYRAQVPRQKLDQRVGSLGELALPFLPQLSSVEALLKLLRTGDAPGVLVQKRDAQGPLKLHWRGKDPKGRDEQVWLERKRWEAGE